MSGSKIFILDDSMYILELSAAVLRDAGYEVEVASDVSGMVSRLATFKPDLLLLDVILPEGFGYDLVEYLREVMEVTAPVVLFSSMAENLLDEFVECSGASGYIRKDNEISQLVPAVRQFLGAGAP